MRSEIWERLFHEFRTHRSADTLAAELPRHIPPSLRVGSPGIEGPNRVYTHGQRTYARPGGF